MLGETDRTVNCRELGSENSPEPRFIGNEIFKVCQLLQPKNRQTLLRVLVTRISSDYAYPENFGIQVWTIAHEIFRGET